MKKRQIPQHLKDLIQAVGMSEHEATWDCHGTPVIYHDALERIAEHQSIMFDKPTIIETIAEKGIVAMLVQGTNGDKTAWSIGEASPHNSKNSYPFAMSEKRAKDRVILKLIGASGFVYSEEEADSFQNPDRYSKKNDEPVEEQPQEEAPPPFVPDPNSVSIIETTKTDEQMRALERDAYEVLLIPSQISRATSAEDLGAWFTKSKQKLDAVKQNYPKDYLIIKNQFEARWKSLSGE
jgi:hypothetical protein